MGWPIPLGAAAAGTVPDIAVAEPPEPSRFDYGRAGFRAAAQEYGDHPSAVYARFALGVNQARPFTTVEPDGEAGSTVKVRVRGRARSQRVGG
ncbi:hypothetical protein ALI144C_08450 [Actinosynnema sp. ALI-1.44]|uniref:hypothetical protein n=1 Tax=Actinosynnema sp. ALI-1.44 TaxID=1933779 RepID=UPI00097C7779|nr:hypothetical protein [Actinosynnema sp. ALI-1.44]ONI87420.1 hypothetical protein ALI144C_08450 [Actinosynnema sp. ALI-1.44]